MYSEHTRAAAARIADNMKNAVVPMYGAALRLPDRKAVISILRLMRSLMFPAYYGDSALMTLSAQDYAALLLDHIERDLTRQIALALPVILSTDCCSSLP